ncbi:MAG TPA: ATP-binding protein, partial [Verrucomicrobiae bacterium]|nr:ATP-binding protein [Verrucomicrobiae bacterium]
EKASGLRAPQVIGKSMFEMFPEITARRLQDYFHRALHGEVSVLSSTFHEYLLAFPPAIRDSGFLHMRQTARIAPLWQDGRIIGAITTIEDVTERDHQNALLEDQHKRDQLLTWALTQLLQAAEPGTLVASILDKVSEHIGADTYLNYLIEDSGLHFRLHDSRGLTGEAGKQMTLVKLDEVSSGGSAPDAAPGIAPVPDLQHLKLEIANVLGLRACVCHPMLVGHRLIGALVFGSHARSHFEIEEVELTRTISQFVAVAIDRGRREKALLLAQQELSRHAATLEYRVKERTAKLQETVAELEAFSFSLAHDVRAPLRHLKGFAQALLDELGPESSGASRNYAELILQASQRLDAFTKDILDYARVSREPVRLVRVDLDETLRNIISRNPALAAPGVVTIKSPLTPVMGVPNLLQQSLANLLENALKFIRPGVAPQIEVYTESMAGKRNDSQAITGTLPTLGPGSSATNALANSAAQARTASRWVRIWVEDNGIGIPPEFHKKIFGVFERLWNQDEFEGTGIGLAIVSKAIQRMGGTFGVESKGGSGSKFWLQLPEGL